MRITDGMISFNLLQRGREEEIGIRSAGCKQADGPESRRASVTTCTCTVPVGLVLWSRLPYENRVVERGRCEGSGK